VHATIWMTTHRAKRRAVRLGCTVPSDLTGSARKGGHARAQVSAHPQQAANTFSACAFAIAYAVWLMLAAVRSCMSVQASDVSSDVAPYLCSAIEPRT
jgi:hypothetical protein